MAIQADFAPMSVNTEINSVDIWLDDVLFYFNAVEHDPRFSVIPPKTAGPITQGECIMARFPRAEADVRVLAQNIITGMTSNPDFPSPPIVISSLQALLDSFINLNDEQVAAQAAAKQVTDAKQAAFEELIAAMKILLHYAEDTVRGDDAKLAAIGWGAKAPGTPLAIPGQTRLLEASQQGAGWVLLDWKRPADGGAASFYRIERRTLSEGEWVLAGMSVTTEVLLNNQERGKEWEYRTIAVNKKGDGAPSNSVTVVM
jgi:hypothetical protein